MSQLVFIKRARATMDANEKGRWITTEEGNHVHLDKNGKPDKGNPHVIKAMKSGGNKDVGNKSDNPKKKGGEKDKTPKKDGLRKEAKGNGAKEQNPWADKVKYLRKVKGYDPKRAERYGKEMYENAKSESQAKDIVSKMKGGERLVILDILGSEYSTPIRHTQFGFMNEKQGGYSTKEIEEGLKSGRYAVYKDKGFGKTYSDGDRYKD